MIKEGAKSSKDKRREPRITAENRILLKPLLETSENKKDHPYCVLTEDVSPGGCRVLSDRSFRAGTLLRIELGLSKVRKVIKAKGEVRWTKSVEDGELFEMGIKFVDLPPESLVALLEYSYKEVRSKKTRH